jgi:DNA-binding transcriptional LysR family regulator
VLSHALDFRLFRYALASAEHGSFRRAAAALNVQQSTVSKGIRNLEHRLGATLFERGHSGIRPTPVGDQFLEDASLGFDHFERAMKRIGALQRGEHGELAVAASVPFFMLGDIFERFREQYQGVSVQIAESTCTAGNASVRMRKVDIAFATKPAADDLSRSLHLRDERMIVVLPTPHPLAELRAVLLEDLRSERFILGASGIGPEIAGHIRRHMSEAGHEPNIQMHGVGQCDLIAMVARGFGVTVVAGRLSHAAPDGVVLVPLAGKNVVPVHAVWMDTNPNPTLKGLLDIAQRIAGLQPQKTRSEAN